MSAVGYLPLYLGSELGSRIASVSLVGENLTDKVYVDHLNRLKYVGIRNAGRNITVKLEIPLSF